MQVSIQRLKRELGFSCTTYLEDVRSGTGDTTGNGLDEAGHLAHHIDTIQALAEGSVYFG